MPVCAIIGVDEAGKSTLIGQLKEKYPDKIDVLAFPTLPLREKLATLSIDYTDIHSILNYHMRFQFDFIQQQEIIKKPVYRFKKLLILDRYFYCSLAYLRHAVLKHHSEDYWQDIIKPIFYNFYKYHLHQPDLILWLVRGDLYLKTEDEHNEIQHCYHEELTDWYFNNLLNQDDYTSISALQPDTFEKVEESLKNKGFI